MDPQEANMQRSKPGFFANSTNLLLIAIFFMIILLIGGISFLIFGANNAGKKTSQTAQQNPVTISKNWGTFTSSQGVTIDYPDNLKPVEDSKTQTVTFVLPEKATSFMTVSVINTPFTNAPTGDRVVEGKKFVSEWKQITVNGQTGHSYIRDQCETECKTRTVDLPFKGGTQILSITSITEDKAQFDEIVQRIKFTP